MEFKLIKFAEDKRVELYDLSSDVSEQSDLSDKLPAVANELDDLLEQKLKEMNSRRATHK
jgi:hypothetical protein